MKIICFGDSNTFGYDPRGYFGGRYDCPWPELLAERPDCTVLNWGGNGREIPVRAVDFPADADLIIVMLGTNDLLQGASAEVVCGRMARFLENLDHAKLLLIAPPPMKLGAWVPGQNLINDSAALSEHYRTLAQRLDVSFADAGMWDLPLAFDGVHLTDEGHRRLAEKLSMILYPEADMIDCISVENMRQSDAYTIANLVPGLELMYRAAYGVFKAYDWPGSTAIVVGSGNNGGDGFALAWILKERGFACTVFTVSRKMSPDSAYYAEKAREAGVSVRPFGDGCLDGFSSVVDCLLGTGFSGTVRGACRDAIEAINASPAFVISVDINSGMNGDTGEAELAVRSDLTVTIGYVKTGLAAENAGNYMKRLVCADIGIVLVRKEGSITRQTCPPWLDMNIISSK